MQGHDKPEHPHIMLESGDLLLNEDGTWLYHEQYEEISRLRQEGDPYNFIQLEDYSGDLMLEEQPRVTHP